MVRRITSLILSVALMFVMCCANICIVSADAVITETLFEDFEDDVFGFTPVVDGDANVSYEKFSNNPIYKNAVKMDVSESATIAGKSYLMNSKGAFVRNNEGADLYTEVSFDIAPSISNLRPMYLYMRNKDANKTLFTLKWQNQKFIISKDKKENELCDYQDGQMMNVRVVAQLTDSTGASVDRITAVYVNDNLVGESLYPVSFENVGTGKFDQLSMLIRNTSLNQPLSAFLDNVRVVEYQAEDGVSPMADNKYALGKSIDTIYNFIKSNDEYMHDAEKETLNAVMDDAVSMYKNSYASTSDVEEMIQQISDAIENCPITVPKYKIVMFENFDDDEITYKKETGTYVLDSPFIDGLNSKMYDTSLKFDLSDKLPLKEGEKTSYYYSICASNDIGSAFFRNTEKDMMYVETEFDVATFGTMETARPVYVYLQNSTSNKTLAYVSLDTGAIRTSTGKIGTYEEGETLHFKIVYQFNDADGNACGKVAAIYKNGELLAENIDVGTDGTDKFDRVMIFAAVQFANKTNVGCYFDNLCITKYNSVSGVSEAPAREKAAILLKSAYNKINKSELAENVSNELIQECDLLADLYRNQYSKEAMAEICTGAEYVLNRIDFIGGGDAVKLYSPVTIGDIRSDSMYMRADLMTKSKLDNVYTAAVLMKESDGSVSGECLQYIINKAALEPDNKNSVTAEFDLTGIDTSEREKLYVKLFAFTINNENNLNLIGSYNVTERNYTFNDDNYTFSDGTNIYQTIKNDGSSDKGQFIVTINGSKNENVLLLMLKKDIAFNDFCQITNSDELQNSIEYITAETTDEQANAVFEKTPSDGMGEYCVITMSTAGGNVAVKSFYDISYIDNMLVELYANKNAAVIESYKDCLGVTGSVYQSAVTNKFDIDSEVKILLDEKTYTKYDINQFGKSFLDRLGAVSAFYDAKNVDSVELAFAKYSNYITNYKNLKNMRNTATYIYDNRKSIKSIDALNTVFDAAVKNGSGNNENSGNSGGSSGGGGGKGGSNVSYGSDGILSPGTVGNDANSSTMQEYLNAYDDLDGYEWVKEAIVALSAKGYISGKGDKKFAPSDNITREEFVKIAVLVFNMYNENAVTDFADVKAADWFYKYVASACENEIINGVEEGVFGTGRNLSREDLAVIIYRMMKKTNVQFTEDGEYIEFVDEGLFSDYAQDAIKELAKSGVVNGIGNNEFAPKNLCTRAEAAKMLHVAYKLKEGVK